MYIANILIFNISLFLFIIIIIIILIGSYFTTKCMCVTKEKVGDVSGTDSIQSQISSKTSRWTIKDITSDSQVNSQFPYRWSPASQILNMYCYLFSVVVIICFIKKNKA